MRFTLASIVAFVASAAAVSVTSPTKNEDVDLSNGVTIKWSSVSSDPSSFSIYLVNMNSYPNVDKLIADDVKTSDGSYTIDSLSGIDNGSGFQINLISKDPKNSGILAQSQQFNVESSSSSSSTTTAASSTSTGKTTTTAASTTSSATSASSATSSATSSSITISSSAASSSTATVTPPGSSTLATSASASASSSINASSSGSASASATPTTVDNGAGALAVPAAAGSLLMGLFALVL
ncbi:hypothetical protein AWENTII_011511 [Aspergillus wentii]|nr:hypothetical protein MW887_003971 [Aspergillus wentii]